MIKYVVSPEHKERVSAIKANLARAGKSPSDLGRHFGVSASNIYDTFKGRYEDDVLNESISNYETYLHALLGVRYVEPYLKDLNNS